MEGRTRKGSKVSRFWLRHLEQLGHQLKQPLSFSRLVSLGLEKRKEKEVCTKCRQPTDQRSSFSACFFLEAMFVAFCCWNGGKEGPGVEKNGETA